LSMSEEALRLAVDASIVNLRDVAATRKIELRVSYPPETPQFVGDWQRLRVVLENLLANAVRFTPNGGLVELVIAVEGDQILLRVRDTGAGIPPAQLARIFDSFRQVEEPNTRHYGGLGLGLSIIQRAIASMSGKITVESTLGVGSTFTIVLPLRGTPIPVAPEPNGDLRSSLLRHIQSLQARLDNSERYAAQLATELQQYRPEPVGNA
jgi:signal transduction histidine kinase